MKKFNHFMKKFNQKFGIAAVLLLGSAASTMNVQAEGEAPAQASWISALTTNASAKTVALSAAGCLTALGAIKLAKKVPGFFQDSLLWLKKNQVGIEGSVGCTLIGAAAGILISSPVLLCDKNKLNEAILVSLSAYLLSVPILKSLLHNFIEWVIERDQLRRHGYVFQRYYK